VTTSHDLISLVYASTATRPFRQTALDHLLVEFRRFNLANSITGLLLYRDGKFIQALEGERDTVMALIERIGRDPRHHDMRVLLTESIEQRRFSQWSMGYRSFRLGVDQTPDGFRDSFADIDESSDPATTARALGEITLWFHARELAPVG